MLSFLYFPVTCNPSRAVTLPDIGVPQCIGVPHRYTYPCHQTPTTDEKLQVSGPLSNEHGTHKTVKARFWPWLSGRLLSNRMGVLLHSEVVRTTPGSDIIRTSMYNTYSGSLKITSHLDHIGHCERSSGTDWSNRWTYRVFIIHIC